MIVFEWMQVITCSGVIGLYIIELEKAWQGEE